MENKMSNSEKKILRKIREWLGRGYGTYDFWFIHDDNEVAISWEGGFGIGQSIGEFRNQYTVIEGDEYKNGKVKKNW